MVPLTVVLLLATAYLAVFFQSTFDLLRNLVGAQVDLLPGLIVYTSLSHGITALALVAVLGGLMLDAMSANPLGISILPLFIIGFVIHYYRTLILREQTLAQLALGLGASCLAPILTVLLLLNVDKRPLLGWIWLWQWFVMSILGAVITPFWFRFFDWISGAVNYRPVGETSFRSDRQIKRGRF